jgi:membrane-associated protein
MHLITNLPILLQSIGYLGLFIIVFAESGLFFGFFLPGDSLLFTAGLLAATGSFSLAPVIIITLIAAILGDSVGYYFGTKTGPLLFKRNDSLFFKKRHLERSSLFYEKHGSKTILLARFVPIVRTFAPIIAGASHMEYKKFLVWNAVGGVFWTLLLTILGYLLGSRIPNIDHYILPIVLGIIFISFVPIFWNLVKKKQSS